MKKTAEIVKFPGRWSWNPAAAAADRSAIIIILPVVRIDRGPELLPGRKPVKLRSRLSREKR